MKKGLWLNQSCRSTFDDFIANTEHEDCSYYFDEDFALKHFLPSEWALAKKSHPEPALFYGWASFEVLDKLNSLMFGEGWFELEKAVLSAFLLGQRYCSVLAHCSAVEQEALEEFKLSLEITSGGYLKLEDLRKVKAAWGRCLGDGTTLFCDFLQFVEDGFYAENPA